MGESFVLDYPFRESPRLLYSAEFAQESRQLTQLVRSRPPLEGRPDAPIIRALVAAVRAVRGQDPRLTGESPWFDAALLAGAGIPAVMFGPAGAGAHAAEEWVEIPSVVTCAEVLADVARRFCAGTG